jgi:hypothetical protein
VLSSNDDWKAQLRQEVDEQAALYSLPDQAEKVGQLIEALEDDRDLSGLVEPTYQATRKLLGET